MILFWLFWTINALAGLTALYFFFAGMADGSVSSGNLDLWLLLLGALGGILTGNLWLRNIQHGRWACALVIVPAIPLLGFVVILMVAIVTGARWN